MNFISNIYGFFYNMFNNNSISVVEPIVVEPIIVEPVIVEPIIDEPIIDEPNIEPINETIYMFINTANIYNANELMMKRLYSEELNNKYIKIYLLKSDTLDPLFKNELIVNNNNIQLIENKMSKRRRHLHTFIDAIDSFIEYNNIRNYHIFY